MSASWVANARWARDHVVKVLGDGDLEAVPWGELGQLGVGLRPRSRGLVVHLARSWILWAAEEGHGVPVGAVRHLPRVRVPPPDPRGLSRVQVERIRRSYRSTRERVVVELGVVAGLRRAELAALRVEDLDLEALVVLVRRGKGGRRRVVPITVEVAAAVRAYLLETGHRGGPLIRAARDPSTGIGPQAVWELVDRVLRRAEVKVEAHDGVSVHALRHTAGTRAHELTGDLVLVRDFLGHSSVATTQRYCAPAGVDRLRAALGG